MENKVRRAQRYDGLAQRKTSDPLPVTAEEAATFAQQYIDIYILGTTLDEAVAFTYMVTTTSWFWLTVKAVACSASKAKHVKFGTTLGTGLSYKK